MLDLLMKVKKYESIKVSDSFELQRVSVSFMCVCVNREQCRGQSRVTETVGPSVVKTQKSSDNFCGIERSKRKKEREEANQSCSVSTHTLLSGTSHIPG